MNVLICDDHELFRSGLRLAIEELKGDHRVTESADLESARNLLNANDIDLLLLDLDLPDGTGQELLSFANNQANGIRVVVISASESLADVRRAMENGAQRFHT